MRCRYHLEVVCTRGELTRGWRLATAADFDAPASWSHPNTTVTRSAREFSLTDSCGITR
jgi:hypothetical protein